MLKQRAKHPIKVYIWGGISKRGATDVIIFTGIMDAERLVTVFEAGLLPFLRDCYPDGHHLQQDNNPKYVSNRTKDFLNNMVLIGG